MSNVKINEAKLLQNRVIEHTDCEECMEDFIFQMKDDDGEFYIGMKTIIGCVLIAEKEEIIPKLEHEWLNAVRSRYEL